MKFKKVTKAVFPVAGMGTRFLPATKSIPKEIMTLVDRPLIQYAIDEARAAQRLVLLHQGTVRFDGTAEAFMAAAQGEDFQAEVLRQLEGGGR